MNDHLIMHAECEEVDHFASCNNSIAQRAIVTINVSGKRYQTYESTLDRYPNTLLGCHESREVYYNADNREYFFDRHRSCFNSILYYYQSEGTLTRPLDLAPDIFVQECTFFGLADEAHKLLGFDQMEDDGRNEQDLPKNKLQCAVWTAFEMPSSSIMARFLAIISLTVIIVSIMVFCLESLPSLQNKRDIWFAISAICNAWFTLEFLLRLISSPDKIAFLKGTLNIIDVLSILPFYVQIIMDATGAEGNAVEVLRVLRIIRVVRIFKLTRHSRGLYILGHTLKSSRSELFMLLLFMILGMILFSSGVYYCENGANGAEFPSIPHSFWWAIVTMTTVGYGDVSPKTNAGKVIGAMCALSGVLAIALPVPVIVSNFEYYYKEELARQVAEQAKQKAKEDIRRDQNNFLHHLPPNLTSSDLDQEILELKGIAKNNKLSDSRGTYSKVTTPSTTPNTMRKKPETTL